MNDKEALENIRDIHVAWFDIDEALDNANVDVETRYDRCCKAMDAICDFYEKALDPGRPFPLFVGPGEGLIPRNDPAISTIVDDECGHVQMNHEIQMKSSK